MINCLVPESRQIFIEDGIVTKRAVLNKDKLKREIEWLLYVSKFFPKHVPHVLEVTPKENALEYKMPYYPYINFAEYVKEEPSPSKAINILDNVFDFVINYIHPLKTASTPHNFILDNYINKIKARIVNAEGKSSTFDSIIKFEKIIFNSRSLVNFSIILDELINMSKNFEKISPPFICFFHGDLKLDNILINLKENNFMLIDPRGSTPSGEDKSDYLEDWAKLRTSTHSHYDLIRADYCMLDIKENIINLSFLKNANKVLRCLNLMDNHLLQLLSERYRDSNLIPRLLFLESVLLLANAPFQMESGNEKEERIAIALYLKGLDILNHVSQLLKGNLENEYIN